MRPSPWARPTTVAALYLAIALAATWPLARVMSTQIAGDPGDTLFNCWVLQWTSGQLLQALAEFSLRLAIMHPECQLAEEPQQLTVKIAPTLSCSSQRSIHLPSIRLACRAPGVNVGAVNAVSGDHLPQRVS